MSIDTVAARAFPTVARVERFLSIARRFLSRQNPPAQLWQMLLGHMSSLEKLVPTGDSGCARYSGTWSPTGPPRGIPPPPPHLPVPRSWQVKEDLSWWMVRDHLLKGMIQNTKSGPSPVFGRVPVGMGSSPPRSISVGDMVEQESSLHINLLEMKALFLALQLFVDVVTDHRVTAMCGNSTVVAYVNQQGGTVSDSLCSLPGQLL